MIELVSSFIAALFIIKLVESSRFYSKIMFLINYALLISFFLMAARFYVDEYLSSTLLSSPNQNDYRYYAEQAYFFLLICHILANRHFYLVRFKSRIGFSQNQQIFHFVIRKLRLLLSRLFYVIIKK